VWLVLQEYPGDLALAGGALVVLTLAGHAATGNRRPALPVTDAQP
jgi:hypothetical protein